MNPLVRTALGLAASAAVAGAALSPVADRLADASFAWHMTQHVVLLYAATLLVLLADPFGAFAAIADKYAVARTVRAVRRFHVIAHPAAALAAVAGVLWLSHFSGLYEAALEHPAVHATEHALYFFAGTCFWLPIVAPHPLRPPAYPARLLYALLALPQGALLGLALDAATVPLYAHYAAAQGSVAAALADQRAAAAIMWIAGGAVAFAAFMATLGIWAARETRAETA